MQTNYEARNAIMKNYENIGLFINGYTKDDYLKLVQKVEAWNGGNKSTTFSTSKVKKYFKNDNFTINEKLIKKYAKKFETDHNFIIVKCEDSEIIGIMLV